MTRFRLFALGLAGALIAAPLMAAEPAAFSAAQKAEIEKIMREVLSKDPDIIVESVQNAQRKKAEEASKKAAENILKLKDKLFENPKDPFIGNPKGTIRIVEFFDYDCGYCKKALEPLLQLVKAEKDVKVIFKEFPILSEVSKMKAKAALAAHLQGKYMPLHTELMKNRVPDEAGVMKIAKKHGLDVGKLKKDMRGSKVAAIIAANRELADSIGARGTPTFLFGEKLIPGAMSLEEMKKLVAELRAKKKN